eukprot:4714129-Prymnesium_polylepis.1
MPRHIPRQPGIAPRHTAPDFERQRACANVHLQHLKEPELQPNLQSIFVSCRRHARIDELKELLSQRGFHRVEGLRMRGLARCDASVRQEQGHSANRTRFGSVFRTTAAAILRPRSTHRLPPGDPGRSGEHLLAAAFRCQVGETALSGA